MPQHSDEIQRGERFEFGENWRRFLALVDEERVAGAVESLRKLLKVDDLKGRRFLDIGSGSGLFSLAARRLGAEVVSFDYDPASVACTTEMRRRFEPDAPDWRITEGSVLDPAFLSSLGTFDVVYSWGVLHHTGAMWKAIENATTLVREGGLFAIAIYNDQGAASRGWYLVKRAYNWLPAPLRFLILWPFAFRIWVMPILRDTMKGDPLRTWRAYSKTSRAMSPWRDVVDWVGGYPFEVATPEQLVAFARERGFSPVNVVTCGSGWGCNELVFRREK